jgi:hypothetical protein
MQISTSSPLFVSGPISLHELYDDKTNKHIYLFGTETFAAFDKCINRKSLPIADFLKNIFTANPNKQFDLLIEEAQITKSSLKTVASNVKSETRETISTFEECFKHAKNLCKFQNVRFHYVDLEQDEKAFLNCIEEYIKNTETGIKNFANSKMDLSKVRDFYTNVEKSHLFAKIEKKLQFVSNAMVRELIRNFLKSVKTHNLSDLEFFGIVQALYGKEIPADASQKLSKSPDSDKSFSVNTQDDLTKLREFSNEQFVKNSFDGLVEMRALLVEAFILEKMYGATITDDYPQNIIVVALDPHVKVIVDFLSSIGVEVVQKQYSNLTESNEFKCVDLRNFKQPFFSDSCVLPKQQSLEIPKKEGLKKSKSALSMALEQQKKQGSAENSFSQYIIAIIICIIIFVIFVIIIYFIKDSQLFEDISQKGIVF